MRNKSIIIILSIGLVFAQQSFEEYKKQLKEPRDMFMKELAFPVNKFQYKNNIKNMING